MIVESTYENAKPGLYIGVVADVVELFNQPTPNGLKNFIRIIWLLDKNDSKGKPLQVMKKVSITLHDQGNLYKVAKQMFGVPPSAGFDTESFLGRANQLFVQENAGANGKVYANVEGILPLPAGAVIPSTAGFVRNKDRKPFVPGQSQAGQASQSVPQATPAPSIGATGTSSNVQF